MNFWNESEIKNQHVHAWWGFWSTFIVYCLYQNNIIVFTGLFIGIIIESLQWFGGADDYIERKWQDIIRDLCFWLFGGLLNYVVLYFK
jgi:hypothetical protein